MTKKYSTSVGKFVTEQVISHQIEHKTYHQRRNEPLLNAAFKAHEVSSAAEAAHLLSWGTRFAPVAGGLASAGTAVSLGLGYAWAWTQMPCVMYGAAAPYRCGMRDRDPQPPEGLRARFRGDNHRSYRNQSVLSAKQSHADYSGFLKSQFKSFSDIGYGKGFAPREFHSVLQSTGLVSSYKSTHPECKIQNKGQRGEIGGVATSVGHIEGLKDSAADVLFNEHVFCMQTPDGKLPFTDIQLKQIIRELSEGIYLHNTYPFFSLHFNNNSAMYPVLHPVYQNTLVGEVIGFLDYFMKGFLNGGIFAKDFLKSWPANPNQDHEFLKSNLHDLKKLYKQNKLPYSSLREKMAAAGLEAGPDQVIDDKTPSVLNNKFRSSFRIIAKHNHIQKHENVFLIDPDFDMKYTIDILPEYQEYLDQYKKTHGGYPEDYLRLRRLYEQECEDIKEQMPKLPLFREYFQMLGVINFFCYYLTTLKEMGKVPDLEKINLPSVSTFPKMMPPIPVRYYKNYPIHLTVGEVLKGLMSQDQAGLNQYLRTGVDNIETEFPAVLESGLNNFLQQYFASKLPQQVREEDDFPLMLSSLQKGIKNIFKNQLIMIRDELHVVLDKLVKKFELDFNAKQTIPEKLAAIRQKNQQVFDENKKAINDALKKSLAEVDAQIDKLKAEKISEKHNEIDAQIQPAIAKEYADIDALVQAAIVKDHQAIEQARVANLANIENQWNALHKEVKHSKKAQALHQQAINECNSLFANEKAKATQNINNQGANLKANVPQTVNQRAQQAKQRASQNIAEFYEARKKEIYQEIGEAHGKDFNTINNDYENCLKSLKYIESSFSDLSQTLTENTDLMSRNLIEKVQFSTLDIADNSFFTEAGDNHKLVGGCGMKLPNIPCEPIEQGDELAAALYPVMASASAEAMTSVDYNGKTYSAFKLKTKNNPAYTLVDHAEMANNDNSQPVKMSDNEFTALSELSYERFTDEPVTLPDFNLYAVDQSGQTVIHYLADFGSAKQFEKIAQLDQSCFNQADVYENLAIHAAVIAGNLEVVKYLIAKNSNFLHAKNNNGATPLILAAQEGQTEIVQALLAAGADANYTLPNGLSPLYLAIQNEHESTAMTLLQKSPGLNVNIQLDNGNTALHLAIEMELPVVATALLAAGADCTVKRKSDDFTPFHCAAENGLTDVCRAMLATGKVDSNMTLASGMTAVHLAAKHGQLDTLQWLVEGTKANINARNSFGNTPIQLALQEGQFATALYLSALCEVNAVNAQKQTMSAHAAALGQFEVADQLIQRGEDPQSRDSNGHNYIYYLLRSGQYIRYKALNPDPNLIFNSLTSLDMAAYYGHKELMDDLIGKNAEFTLNKSTGWELIHFAVKANHTRYLKTWLQAHPDNSNLAIGFGKEEGKTLAYIAAENGSFQCLQELLKTRQHKHVSNNWHLLYAAVKSGKRKILDLVLKKYDDINTTIDADDNTVAHIAVKFGLIKVIKHVMTRGIDLLAKNKFGQTCLHIAILNDDAGLLKKLLKLIPADKRPEDLLEFAFTHKNASCVKLLSKGQKQVDQHQTSKGQTLKLPELEPLKEKLITALMEVKEDEFKTLLTNFPINEVLFSFGNTKLPLLQIAFALEYEWAIKILLEHKAEPMCKDIHGLNIYHHIAKEKPSKLRLRLANKYLHEHKPSLLCDETNHGLSVFQIAALNGRSELLVNFFNDKMINNQLKNGNSLLHQAIEIGSLDLVIQIIEKGADVNAVNNQQVTPLMLAAQQGNTQILEFLLHFGANVNSKDINQNTALHYAIQNKQQICALQLLPLITKVNSKNRDGNTPFILAAAQGLIPVMDTILRYHSNCLEANKKGFNALHLAAIYGHTDVIQYLVEHGFEINALSRAKNKKQRPVTALHLAALQGNINTCQKLISLGAGFNDSDDVNDLINSLITSGKSHIFELIDILDIELKPEHLFTAAASDHTKMLARLLLMDIDPNTRNEIGANALHIACAAKSDHAAALLIDQGINLESSTVTGDTALHVAATSGALNIVRQLCDKKVELEKQNNDGKTALFLACEKGHYSSVLQLLKSGANFANPDSSGLTPAQIAAKCGHCQIAKLLSLFGDRSLTKKAIADLPEFTRKSLEPVRAELNEIDDMISFVIANKLNPVQHAIYTNHLDALRILSVQRPAEANEVINAVNQHTSEAYAKSNNNARPVVTTPFNFFTKKWNDQIKSISPQCSVTVKA